MPRSYPSRISKRGADAALDRLLRDCRVEMLPTFTAEGLAGSYRVTVEVAGRKLAAALAARLNQHGGNDAQLIA